MQNEKTTTAAKSDLWDGISSLLIAMYNEFKDLSKKKPDEVVSKGKIKIVNRLLSKCREVLKSEQSIEYLDLLEEDDLPQNSDVVLMLSQYVAAMKQFKSMYYGWISSISDDGWYLTNK